MGWTHNPPPRPHPPTCTHAVEGVIPPLSILYWWCSVNGFIPASLSEMLHAGMLQHSAGLNSWAGCDNACGGVWYIFEEALRTVVAPHSLTSVIHSYQLRVAVTAVCEPLQLSDCVQDITKDTQELYLKTRWSGLLLSKTDKTLRRAWVWLFIKSYNFETHSPSSSKHSIVGTNTPSHRGHFWLIAPQISPEYPCSVMTDQKQR